MKKILFFLAVGTIFSVAILTLIINNSFDKLTAANVEALMQNEIPPSEIGFDVIQCNERVPLPGNFDHFCRKFNNICNPQKTGGCDTSNNCEHARQLIRSN